MEAEPKPLEFRGGDYLVLKKPRPLAVDPERLRRSGVMLSAHVNGFLTNALPGRLMRFAGALESYASTLISPRPTYGGAAPLEKG